jgi:hypothetical protein
VVATIGPDPSRLAGTDLSGRPRMYAPNPLENGSSVSHWDTPETPNLLMEPFINSDLTGVDLTPYAFADIGWLGTVSAVASGGVSGVPPRAFSAPNPFSTGTSIHFTLAHSGITNVEIYDVRGALVRRLPAAWRPSGTQAVDWDGADGSGRKAPTGIYFWRVAREGAETYTGRVARVQ